MNEEQKKVYTALLEMVRKNHYSNPNYALDVTNVIIYNVCPMCGTIEHSVTREPAEGENPGIYMFRDVESCNNCNQIKFLHPQIYAWVKQIYDHETFIQYLKVLNIQEIVKEEINNEETIH